MRRLLTCTIAALVSAGAAIAANWSIKDINIHLTLYNDGSAIVREVWDMSANEGTEVYVPRQNLGDIKIFNFNVSDETGTRYVNEGSWDTDRSRSQKAGRCGINTTYDGIELCWGIGEYGSHVYSIEYAMSNVVKSLNDRDMLHLQLVNDEMAASPRHVKVTIDVNGKQLDTTWVKMWGFGYEGTTSFEDNGTVEMESTEAFGYKSSVIALLSFEKGFFESSSVQNRDFQEVLDRAMSGADFGSEDEPSFFESLLSMIFTFGIFYLIFIKPIRSIFRTGLTKRQKRKLLGADPDRVDWCRDIPFDGDLYDTDYVLDMLDTKRPSNAIASAIILRLLQNNYLLVKEDEKGKVRIMFNDAADLNKLDDIEIGLYTMMKEASGEDQILQEKEFSRWSAMTSNTSKVRSWAKKVESTAKSHLSGRRWIVGSKFSAEGKKKAQGVFGFKKFLEDFTIVSERESADAALWQDYMVFAALFGIADKVAKQLKDINPQMFEEVIHYNYTTYSDVIRMTDTLARTLANSTRPVYSSSGHSGSSWSGGGGHSSFGGGGGFSGGGHGGGVR